MLFYTYATTARKYTRYRVKPGRSWASLIPSWELPREINPEYFSLGGNAV